MMAAQQGDEDVGGGAPATRRGDGEPLRLEHRPVGDDRAASDSTAPTGSSGRSSASGRQQRRRWAATAARRTAGRPPWWRRLRAGAPAGSGAGRRRPCRPAGPAGSSGGSRRSVPSRPTVTSSFHVSADGAHQAALTKLGSARGPMSIVRSSRNTVSGTTPRGVHSTATVTGRPPDAASSVATASLRADSGAMGSEPWCVGEHPAVAAPRDRRGDERRHALEPRLAGEHGTDELAHADHVRRRARAPPPARARRHPSTSCTVPTSDALTGPG